MTIAQIAARAPLSYAFGVNPKLHEAYNVERVRGYLEKNLGASRKEIRRDLGLNPRTIAKAIRILRGQPR